jgi:hypothetical protein
MASKNKRISRARGRTARELVNETAPPAPRTPEDIAREIHRIELQIAATSRVARESKLRRGDSLPPLERSRRTLRPVGLTLAQARSRRARLFLQAAVFVTSLVLLAGAAAWVYKMWLTARGS